MHYFIIQNTAVMAWWSQQVATQLPGFLNRFVRRMIQCFHKGEAASVSLTVISLSLPAFVLMSSFYIHCKLITFLNHHQAHGSLLWLLFILDCKMNCVFLYIYLCAFFHFGFLPAVFLPVVLVTLPIWLSLWCLSEIHVHVGCHVASWQAHSCIPTWGPTNTKHTNAWWINISACAKQICKYLYILKSIKLPIYLVKGFTSKIVRRISKCPP